MQVVVAERGGAENPRIGDEEPVFRGEIGECRFSVVGQDQQPGLRSLVVAVRGSGQARPEELRPARIPADHVVDAGIGHRHLGGRFRIGARPDRLVDGQAVGHAAEALLDTVVRGADQIYLAELCVDLQHQIVPVGLFDLLPERQQQVLRRLLVCGENQPTRAIKVADDRHD